MLGLLAFAIEVFRHLWGPWKELFHGPDVLQKVEVLAWLIFRASSKRDYRSRKKIRTGRTRREKGSLRSRRSVER